MWHMPFTVTPSPKATSIFEATKIPFVIFHHYTSDERNDFQQCACIHLFMNETRPIGVTYTIERLYRRRDYKPMVRVTQHVESRVSRIHVNQLAVSKRVRESIVNADAMVGRLEKAIFK